MQRVPFSDEDYTYQASKLKPMLSTNIAIYVEDTFCCRDYVFQVSHIPGYIKFKSKVLKQINPNLMRFLGVCFYPYAPTRLRVWKAIPSPTYLHLVYMTSLSDLCFNKKFEQEKKVYVTTFQAAGLQLG